MAVWSNTALSTVTAQFGRFDAEYYKPEFLDTDKILSAIPGATLRSVASKIDVGHVGPMVKHYSDNGVLLLQTQNVREFFLNLDNATRITPAFHASLAKSQVHKGDILIARSGSFGSAAVYLEDEVINSADIIIVEIEDPRINPLYAVTFMNTRHGSAQLVRFASGGVQGHVNLTILEHFRIPIVGKHEQQLIANYVKDAYAARKASAKFYTDAQQILETHLGLDTLTIQKPAGYTATFSTPRLSETFSACRIDAQCFAPLAVFYRNWLNAHARCERLGNLLQNATKGRHQTDQAEGSTYYCSIKHILGSEVAEASKCFPLPGTTFAGKTDLLLAITGATIGKVGIVERYEKLAFSSDLLRLRANDLIDPHYLLLLLDHQIGQVQFNSWVTGSTNGHLAPRDVERVLVPRLTNLLESEIALLVKSCLMKRRESERLLALAKGRVEQLIEAAQS